MNIKIVSRTAYMTLYNKGVSIYRFALELEQQRIDLIKSHNDPCRRCLDNCLECVVPLAQPIYEKIVAYQRTIINSLYYGLLLMIKFCLEEEGIKVQKGSVHNWVLHKNQLMNLFPHKATEIDLLYSAMNKLSKLRKNIDYTNKSQTSRIVLQAKTESAKAYKIANIIFKLI